MKRSVLPQPKLEVKGDQRYVQSPIPTPVADVSPIGCSRRSSRATSRWSSNCGTTTSLVWNSGDDRDSDKDRGAAGHHWFVNTTTDRRYEILDRQLFDGGFVQQHILHANGRNGGSIAMRVCIVIKLGANGLISRIDEYFDPAEIAPLLESTN